MAEKLFYSMGEVAEMFDVNRSLIRYWESNFSILKPRRSSRGHRLFSPQDVENLKMIYHLVKERGMTLEGAGRVMRRRAAGGDDSDVRREAELMTRLKHIRALLVEVREDLKAGGKGIVIDEEPAEEPAASGMAAEAPAPEPAAAEKPAAKLAAGASIGEPAADFAAESVAEAAEEPLAEASPADAGAVPAAAPAPGARKPRTTTPRRARRKPNDDEDKELFAFYEQSLF